MGTKGKGRRAVKPPVLLWRKVPPAEKLEILANHFDDLAELSSILGVPEKKVKAVFTALNQGKNSRIVQSDEFRAGIRRARHRMTDQIRRTEQAYRAGKLDSPPVRSGFNLVRPERDYLEYLNDDGSVTKSEFSKWVSYSVEHLKDSEIYNLFARLVEIFTDSGQYNTWRIEYLAEHTVYTGGRLFKNEKLREDAERSDYIKLSTAGMPLVEYEGNSQLAIEGLQDIWEPLKIRGAVLMLNICFTWQADKAKAMDFMRQKIRKSGNGKNKWGNKRGK